ASTCSVRSPSRSNVNVNAVVSPPVESDAGRPTAARLRCQRARSSSPHFAKSTASSPSVRSARPAYHGAPPMRGAALGTTSRERCPITPSGRTAGKRNREAEHERDRKARQRRADAAVGRMQVGKEVRPEPEAARLRKPLVQAEAHEPRSDHPRPPCRPVEDVALRVMPPRDEPVGEQHAEERHEERPEQEQELLVLREVDAE